MVKSLVKMALLIAVAAPQAARAEGTGILLMAHGGSREWNDRVLELAAGVDKVRPVEVAFGMATRRTLQEAVDKLNARGVSEIVAVPLFISSHSSVITSTEFLLGLRADAPAELAIYASMDHEQPAAAGDSAHAGHGAASSAGATPVVSKAPIARMTPALNAHPLVAQILTSRARSISRMPEQEAVVIVAHGPSADDENQQWLEDMKSLAADVLAGGHFGSVDYLTVRDDAEPSVRDAATKELRTIVATRSESRRVLIVPLLLSFGGIERGIVTRLEGLTHTMAGAALVPDARVGQWVLEMVRTAVPR